MKRFSTKKPATKAARRPPPPIDAARLHTLALGYVARFATSAGRLEAYLLRKLKAPTGAGWHRHDDETHEDETGVPAIDPAQMRQEVTELVARFVAAGYIDDQAFASARSGGLQRRGFGGRHIAQALGQAGIASEVTAAVLPDRQAGREAALTLARKRRLGPFGAVLLDRAAREKQIAVLLRAGHPLDSARKLVNAATVEAAEAWARADEEDW